MLISQLKLFLVTNHVKQRLDEKTLSGKFRITWDIKDSTGHEAASGVYLCRLTADGRRWVETKKMILIR